MNYDGETYGFTSLSRAVRIDGKKLVPDCGFYSDITFDEFESVAELEPLLHELALDRDFASMLKSVPVTELPHRITYDSLDDFMHFCDITAVVRARVSRGQSIAGSVRELVTPYGLEEVDLIYGQYMYGSTLWMDYGVTDEMAYMPHEQPILLDGGEYILFLRYDESTNVYRLAFTPASALRILGEGFVPAMYDIFEFQYTTAELVEAIESYVK